MFMVCEIYTSYGSPDDLSSMAKETSFSSTNSEAVAIVFASSWENPAA
jgi:hypothetical protein